MADYLVLVCDECGKERKEHEALTWLRVRIVGIDARVHDDPRMEGDFCSRECVIKHLSR